MRFELTRTNDTLGQIIIIERKNVINKEIRDASFLCPLPNFHGTNDFRA